ncbi:MAG: RsfS/YbeB/iojap family protein [Eubacteriales bacterium]
MISSLAELFCVCSGCTSNTHVKMHWRMSWKSVYQNSVKGIMPDHTEGYRANSWVLMDY